LLSKTIKGEEEKNNAHEKKKMITTVDKTKENKQRTTTKTLFQREGTLKIAHEERVICCKIS